MKVEVLLVEDDPADILIMQEAIKKTQFDNNISVARDGLEALEFLQDGDKAPPDFILLDLNMSRMDGHQVLKWIKSHDDFRSIPIGILTTSASKKDIEESYRNDASYYITKPSDFKELNDIVKSIDDFWLRTAKLPRTGS